NGARQKPGTARELSSITVTDASGNDTYNFATRRMAIGISDGSGVDLLRFSRMAAGVTLRLSAAGPQKITRGPSGVKLSLNGTFENVIGSAFHDRISGNDAANVIHGGGGKDALWGLGGDDILYGDGGNDALFGGRGNDILFGGSGDDILVGGPGRN